MYTLFQGIVIGIVLSIAVAALIVALSMHDQPGRHPDRDGPSYPDDRPTLTPADNSAPRGGELAGPGNIAGPDTRSGEEAIP